MKDLLITELIIVKESNSRGSSTLPTEDFPTFSSPPTHSGESRILYLGCCSIIGIATKDCIKSPATAPKTC